MPKPGPLSKKQSIILRNRGSLGESSFSDYDDSAVSSDAVQEKENGTPKYLSLKSKASNGGGTFQTPEQDENATDYGLEFSTSNIQNPSPRRCSTLKSRENSIRREDEVPSTYRIASQDETNTPTTYLAKGTAKKATKQKTAEQKFKQPQQQIENSSDSKLAVAPKPTRVEKTPAAVRTTKDVKDKRKQKEPMEMNKKFFREVKLLQNRTDFMIPRLPFSRVIREIMRDVSVTVTCITPSALEALQTATEMYVSQRIQDSYLLTLHRGRVTLEARDMELMNFLKMYL